MGESIDSGIGLHKRRGDGAGAWRRIVVAEAGRRVSGACDQAAVRMGQFAVVAVECVALVNQGRCRPCCRRATLVLLGQQIRPSRNPTANALYSPPVKVEQTRAATRPVPLVRFALVQCNAPPSHSESAERNSGHVAHVV